MRDIIRKALKDNDSEMLRYLCAKHYNCIHDYWELWADTQEQAQLRAYLYGD